MLAPEPALAHGFGERFDLPIPLWLYLYGAAAAVLLSFIVVGFFIGQEHVAHHYPRFDLMRLRLFRAMFSYRPFLLLVRSLSVGLFLLVILTGFFGSQLPGFNFAPAFVWILWWVGLALFIAFVGNIWPLINPWKILFKWADSVARKLGTRGLELNIHYPASLGVWPALALYFVFVWIELISGVSATPFYLALFVVAYSLITWCGMAVFGKHVWLKNGEAFTVLFGILAKFAPTETRVKGESVNDHERFERAAPGDRELNLRPPVVGLARPEDIKFDRLFFVIFMLASVTFDGLMVTPLWVNLQLLVFPYAPEFGDFGFGEPVFILFRTLGLVVLPLIFLALYLGFMKLSQSLGGGYIRFRNFAPAFIYSLVPIALAYHVAHYYTLLLIQGQVVINHVSDPFGWGWDLFGTADYRMRVGLIDTVFVWYSQALLIVAGHAVAVYLAHAVSLRILKKSGAAIRSQIPVLALMVLYTVASLWILTQPIIEVETAMVDGFGL